MRAWRISRNANSTPARWDSDACRQVAAASLAVATACSTSASEARATAPVTFPVAGLCTGEVRPEVASYARPPIQWVMCSGVVTSRW